MSKSSRDISIVDQNLWRYVTRNVKPYKTSAKSIGAPTQTGTRKPVVLGRPSPKSTSTYGGLGFGKVANAPSPLSVDAVFNVDRRTGNRLRCGQLSVDGRIDLHGFTLEQAHAGLAAFIKGAYGRQARCVIVVTGKGRAGEGIGKIRTELPHWLNQPALRSMVLAATEAHVRDGGAGAFYILLKRQRSGRAR